MADKPADSDARLVASRPLGELALLGAIVVPLATLYMLLAPATVNGDGIGYLKQLSGSDVAPGHIGYLPLIRAVTRLANAAVPLDLVWPMRCLTIGCALVGLVLFYLAARRLFAPARARFAVALLGCSHGYIRAAHEVEVYGVASLAVIVALLAVIGYRDARRPWAWAALAGIACGAAPLLHLTLALLAPSVLLLLWIWGRRPRHVLLAIGAAAIVGLPPLLLALDHEGVRSIGDALRWMHSADRGIPYPLSPLNLLIAGWGLSKSLVYSPYLYQSPAPVVALLTVAGIAGWTALIWLARRGPASPAGLRFALVWALPLALFALFFFPSDTDRWLFVMPALALALARAGGRAGAIVLAAVLVTNIAAMAPAALDDGDVRRAATVERLLHRDDLLVSPGHGWAELVGLGSAHPPRRFPLLYFVGAEHDLQRGIARMTDEIEQTFARGGRVFVARLRDRRDSRGFKELRRFGFAADRLQTLLSPYAPRATAVDGLWQLSPPRP